MNMGSPMMQLMHALMMGMQALGLCPPMTMRM
jgi:hypothetical protein